MSFQWINLYQLAKLSGLVYFEAFVDSTTNKALGWISRSGVVPPYSYDCYYSDGVNQVITTRGTYGDARWCIQGLQAHFAMPSAVILMHYVETAAREGWIIADNPPTVYSRNEKRLACDASLARALYMASLAIGRK